MPYLQADSPQGVRATIQFRRGAAVRCKPELPRDREQSLTSQSLVAEAKMHRLQVGREHTHHLDWELGEIRCRQVHIGELDSRCCEAPAAGLDILARAVRRVIVQGAEWHTACPVQQEIKLAKM